MLRHTHSHQTVAIKHSKTYNIGEMVQCIETHVQQNPFPGIFFGFLAGAFGYIQALPQNPSTLEHVCKVIGQISILIGFIIALLTLLIKGKEFYTTFFKKDKPVRKRKKPLSSDKEI